MIPPRSYCLFIFFEYQSSPNKKIPLQKSEDQITAGCLLQPGLTKQSWLANCTSIFYNTVEMTDCGSIDKAINCVWYQGTGTPSSNLLLYGFCQTTYINTNGSDVINFSISTMASEATHATCWGGKKVVHSEYLGCFRGLTNDPAIIKMQTDAFGVLRSEERR